MKLGHAKFRKPQRGHAFAIIITCFLVSGILRLFVAGTALAEQLAHPEEVSSEHTEINCPAPEDADVLLTVVQERAGQLDKREQRLTERLAVLELAEVEFKTRSAELIEAEQRLAATLAIADNAAENDINKLTAVYENMKAKNAAEIFDSMDPGFAAGFLIRMSPKAAADIMTSMSKELAYSASVIMATRNVGAPTK